jgi:hypothetical protein
MMSRVIDGAGMDVAAAGMLIKNARMRPRMMMAERLRNGQGGLPT